MDDPLKSVTVSSDLKKIPKSYSDGPSFRILKKFVFRRRTL